MTDVEERDQNVEDRPPAPGPGSADATRYRTKRLLAIMRTTKNIGVGLFLLFVAARAFLEQTTDLSERQTAALDLMQAVVIFALLIALIRRSEPGPRRRMFARNSGEQSYKAPIRTKTAIAVVAGALAVPAIIYVSTVSESLRYVILALMYPGALFAFGVGCFRHASKYGLSELRIAGGAYILSATVFAVALGRGSISGTLYAPAAFLVAGAGALATGMLARRRLAGIESAMGGESERETDAQELLS